MFKVRLSGITHEPGKNHLTSTLYHIYKMTLVVETPTQIDGGELTGELYQEEFKEASDAEVTPLTDCLRNLRVERVLSFEVYVGSRHRSTYKYPEVSDFLRRKDAYLQLNGKDRKQRR